MITEQQREELIQEVLANDLIAPEQVTDMVLMSAEKGGYDAGIAVLYKCIKNDQAEAQRLGIDIWYLQREVSRIQSIEEA